MKDRLPRVACVIRLALALLMAIGLYSMGSCGDDDCVTPDLQADVTGDIPADQAVDLPEEVQPDIQVDIPAEVAEDVQPDVVEDVQPDVVDEEMSAEAILVAGPVSLTGRYIQEGQQQLWGIQAALLWVNEVHGGVVVDGVSHPLEFRYTDDASGASTVASFIGTLCGDEDVDFIMGPYSSGLTAVAAPLTEACDKILLNVAGASDSLFEQGYEYVVQTQTPGSQYHLGFLDMVAKAVGTSTALDLALAYETDAFAASVAMGVRDAVGTNWNYNIVFDGTYPAGAVDAALGTFVASLIGSSPDIIVGGGHAVDSRALTRVLADQGYDPLAMSLLVGPANSDFYLGVEACPYPCDYLNHPAEGVSAPAQWALGVTYNEADTEAAGDKWFGPSTEEFIDLFQEVAGLDKSPAYQAAQAAGIILTLVVAIEEADSLATIDVRDSFDELELVTFFGGFDIDETGLQVAHSMVELQWQYGRRVIVWPEEARTQDLVYPMP